MTDARFVNIAWKILQKADRKYPRFTSAHEALGVIREEYKEFEAEVFKRSENRDPKKMLHELADIAASCWRAALSLGLLGEETDAPE